MEVCSTAYKTFWGKIKRINKKEALKGEFRTPPCLVSSIPKGTVYYEIILEKGTLKFPDKEILKSEVKLVFFGDPWGRELSRGLDKGKGLVVGKNCCFSVQSWSGGYWVSGWKEN